MGLISRYVGFEDSPDLDFKVNAIIDFWSNPCDAPWTVYIETLYPAAGRFFLAIIDTSLLDIAREYLRPRAGLTRGNQRKKGRRRGWRGLPRVDGQMIGRLIPGAQTLAGMEYGANTKFLWQIDGIIQRGLWYVVLIDATTDGFYWWAQGIKEIGFCKPINRPFAFAYTDRPFAIAFAGLWFIAGVFTKRWGPPEVDISFSNVHTPGAGYRCHAFCSFHNPHNFFADLRLRWRGAPSGTWGKVVIPPKTTAYVETTALTPRGGSLGLESRLTGVLWLEGQWGSITVHPPQ
jgi:hypothetical protein